MEIKEIIKLRHELHKLAELSNMEQKTKAHLIDLMRAHFEKAGACNCTPDSDRSRSCMEIVDRGNWFYAHYRAEAASAEAASAELPSAGEAKAPIAFRTEIDALPMPDIEGLEYASITPGVSHRCGHEGHAAMLAAFACHIAELACGKKGEQHTNDVAIDRDIYFVFQHAEETGDGAKDCAALIDEAGISEIFAFHNWSGFPEKSVILKESCVMYASKGLTISMKGSPAHASRPEDGKNPSYALGRLLQDIEAIDNELRRQPEAKYEDADFGITVVGVNAGGRNFGIAASEGEVNVTIRASVEALMDEIQRRISEKAVEYAEKYLLELRLEESDVFPETRNDAKSVDKVRKLATELGLQTVELEEAFRSSEDFGYYQKKCNGALILIGNGLDYPQIHTYEYDFNDEIIETVFELFNGLLDLESSLAIHH